MTSRQRLLPVLGLVALLAVAALKFGGAWFGSSDSSADAALPPGHPVAGTAAESLPATSEPSSENVSHDFKARIAALEARLASAPTDTAALGELARLQYDAHALDEAIDLYERYLAEHQESRQPWLDLATAYAGQQQWSAAESTMVAMLDYFPDDPAATYNLGAIMANQGRVEEAASWWHKTTTGPDSSLAEFARSSLRQITGS